MLVKDFMTSNLFVLNEDSTVADAADLMTEKGISIVPIVNQSDKLVGIVTESDFVGKEIDIPHAVVTLKQLFGRIYHRESIEKVYESAKSTKIKDVMSKEIKTVNPESSLSSVVDTMVSNHIKRLPVIKDGKLVGIITRKDLLRAFKKINENS